MHKLIAVRLLSGSLIERLRVFDSILSRVERPVLALVRATVVGGVVAKGIVVVVVTVTTGMPSAGMMEGTGWLWVVEVAPEVVCITRRGWARDGVEEGVVPRAVAVGADAVEATGGGTYACAALAAGNAII